MMDRQSTPPLLRFSAVFSHLTAGALALLLVVGMPPHASGSTQAERAAQRAAEKAEREAQAVTMSAECEAGNGESCAKVGNWLRSGIMIDGDLPKAVTMLQRGCDLGNGEACGSLAGLHARGRGVAKSWTQVRLLSVRGCEANHAHSCNMTASMLSGGTGGPHDFDGARDAASKACTLEPTNQRYCNLNTRIDADERCYNQRMALERQADRAATATRTRQSTPTTTNPVQQQVQCRLPRSSSVGGDSRWFPPSYRHCQIPDSSTGRTTYSPGVQRIQRGKNGNRFQPASIRTLGPCVPRPR